MKHPIGMFRTGSPSPLKLARFVEEERVDVGALGDLSIALRETLLEDAVDEIDTMLQSRLK